MSSEATTPLMEILRSMLAGGKRLTFYDFMNLALHHPEHGYYAKPEPVVGTHGDFMTSPALHPAFGSTLWVQIKELLQHVGGDGPFKVMEVGAGAGQMARDILNAARRDGWGSRIRYLIREQSPRLQEQQRETILTAWNAAPVDWVGELDPALSVHVIVMNELMSALPVHRLVHRGGGSWQEVYVVLSDDGRLDAALGPVSEPAAVEAVTDAGVPINDGQIVDVNIDAVQMLATLAACLAPRGFILNIDYGGQAELVYHSSRPHGNVRCYYRQQPVADLFARPGRQDITADVDFDLLSRAGHDMGLVSTPVIPQGVFLVNLGIESQAEALARRIAAGDVTADPELQKVYALYAPEALGNSFWVMIHAKGFSSMPPLSGFTDEDPQPKSLAELILGVPGPTPGRK